MQSSITIQRSQDWINRFVIPLNICPFAAFPMQHERVRFVVFERKKLSAALELLAREINLLQATPAHEVETTFLIFQSYLKDFYQYLAASDAAQDLLSEMGVEGTFQLATFHPHYQFAETNPDDVENYTNRSPFPMWHILREESVEKAIEIHGNTDSIPENNITRLRAMGIDEVRKLMKD